MKVIALIVAAGKGSRAGGKIPKQYQALLGHPLLRHSLKTFHDHPEIDDVLVVWNEKDQALYEEATKGIELLPPISGGETRQGSVLNGLKALRVKNPDIVLIHDAARAFVSNEVITNVISKVREMNEGAIPALPINDTLKKSEFGKIQKTISREQLYGAQTPQGFIYEDILQAHQKFEGMELTDDASLIEEGGGQVHIVEGCLDNFKITHPEDFIKANKLFGKNNMETRVGQGFDVHRFEAGDKVILCGVDIPFTQSLKGHSDADVAMHAIVDALLGALSLGDIGDHFPPSDPKWKGAPSSIFMKHVYELIENNGATVSNIDLTLMCEAPKISPYKTQMRENVAEILKIEIERVSVKATTTEKLGFTGRGEGIAAQAIATLKIKSDF